MKEFVQNSADFLKQFEAAHPDHPELPFMRQFVTLGQVAAESRNGMELLGKTPLEWINAKDLTSDELRASNLPDSSIHAIWASFNSQTDRRYQAVHVYEHPRGPFILLCGLDKDKTDFRDVVTTVAELTGGNPERDSKKRINIYDRSTDISNAIALPIQPSQNIVAGFTERYAEQFKDVRIPIAYYRNVPLEAYTNPGFAQTKLSFTLT